MLFFFTLVTKLLYREKLRGYGKTDCVVTRSEGMEGDIFEITKPYELWGSPKVEVCCVHCWNLSMMEKELYGIWNVPYLLSPESDSWTGGECGVRIHEQGCLPEKHARKSLLSTSAGAVICISATLDIFKLQSKTVLTVPKQAHKLMSRGSGDTVGHGCDDLLAGSSTTKHDSPLSSSDAIKSCLDAFERGILVLCLQMCQSKSTLWLNGVYDVSYVVGIFLTLKKSRC